MSLEIQHVSYKDEMQLYPDDGEEHWKRAKFIEVRAKKNEKDQQRHIIKKIKLDLVDHSGEHGIPYDHKIGEEGAKEEEAENLVKSEVDTDRKGK